MKWPHDAKVIVHVSKKKWVEGESIGVELGFEGNTAGDMDLDKAYDEMHAKLEAKAEAFLSGRPTKELGGVVTLADVAQANREKGFKDVHVEEKAVVAHQKAPVEMDASGNATPNSSWPDEPAYIEKPPLPGEDISTQTGPAIVEEVRTPIAENGDELEEIPVDYFIVVIKKDGEKYAKAYNKKYHKFGVTVWPEVMKESSIGDVQEYEIGQRLEPTGGPLIGLGEKAEDSEWASKIVDWK